MNAYLDFINLYVIGSIQMLTGFYFLAKFLKKQIKPYYYILLALLSIAVIRFIPSGGFAELSAYALLLFAEGIIICKADIVLTSLYAAIIVVIMQLCYGIFNSLLCILYPFMLSLEYKSVGIAVILFGNMALPVAVLCYHVVYKYFLHDENVKAQYVLMILTPVFMLFFTGQYINSAIYGNTIELDTNGNIVNTDHYHMLIILHLFGIASVFCIMSAYKKLLENFKLSKELSLLEQEEHYLHQYVEEAKTRLEKTKSFRHDVKNHITVIKELLHSNNLKQAIKYIDDMEEITEVMSFPCNTNNPVVDVLLGNKLGLAKSNGINVYCSLILPNPCNVNDMDLCIILSNALDNAINACRKTDESIEKYICVTGKIHGDFILLQVENSFQGKKLFKMGTGLSNIKAAAKKYNGAISVKTHATAFTLTILLVI